MEAPPCVGDQLALGLRICPSEGLAFRERLPNVDDAQASPGRPRQSERHPRGGGGRAREIRREDHRPGDGLARVPLHGENRAGRRGDDPRRHAAEKHARCSRPAMRSDHDESGAPLTSRTSHRLGRGPLKKERLRPDAPRLRRRGEALQSARGVGSEKLVHLPVHPGSRASRNRRNDVSDPDLPPAVPREGERRGEGRPRCRREVRRYQDVSESSHERFLSGAATGPMLDLQRKGGRFARPPGRRVRSVISTPEQYTREQELRLLSRESGASRFPRRRGKWLRSKGVGAPWERNEAEGAAKGGCAAK